MTCPGLDWFAVLLLTAAGGVVFLAGWEMGTIAAAWRARK